MPDAQPTRELWHIRLELDRRGLPKLPVTVVDDADRELLRAAEAARRKRQEATADRVVGDLSRLGVTDATVRDAGPQSVYVRATMSRDQRRRAGKIDGVRSIDRAIRVAGQIAREGGAEVLTTADGTKYALDFVYSGVRPPRDTDGEFTVEGVPTDGPTFVRVEGMPTLAVRGIEQGPG